MGKSAQIPEVFYRRILFCTDFSPNADYAYHYALASVRRGRDAQLHILHVLPEPEAKFWQTYLYEIDDVDQKARTDINRRIEESYLGDAADIKQVVVAIRQGRADEEILQYAKSIESDLLVIGRQGSSPFRINIFGNVAEVITRKASCPVLIIPHRQITTHP